MGMYTELNVAFNLKGNTDHQTVIEPLKLMMGDQTVVNRLVHKPNHPLFKLSRHAYMLKCDSYYFHGESHSSIGYDKNGDFWSVTILTNLKNYEDEIENFLHWINPYIESDGYLGTMRDEEENLPILIFRNDENKKMKLITIESLTSKELTLHD